MPSLLHLKNARIWDGTSDDYSDHRDVWIEGDKVIDLGKGTAKADRTMDCDDHVLIPGLIDAHYHAYASEVNVPKVESLPRSYLAHHAQRNLRASLNRGFTTIRDAGGADWSLWQAAEEGLFPSPRIFYSGRAISQTGGHGDSRAQSVEPCGCGLQANLSQVADGVDAVVRAAREELRKGAHQIKIFVSGGVSSPTDPIWMPQFSPEEIRAVVAEAASRRTYVMAHAYTAESISHAVNNGVRSIEHGNLLDEAAAGDMNSANAYLVPTLITYRSLKQRGQELGLPDSAIPKLDDVFDRGLQAIEIARSKQVRIGFGTDLLGPLHADQLLEFELRQEVDEPIEILRSATSVNAEILNQSGKLGCIVPGSFADLVAIKGDPLDCLREFSRDGPGFVIARGRRVS